MAKRKDVRPPAVMNHHGEYNKRRDLWECVIDDTYAEYDKYLPGPQERAHYRRKRLDYIDKLKERGFNDEEAVNGFDITMCGVIYATFADYEKFETSPQGIAQYRRKSREYIDKINAKLKEATNRGDCCDRSDRDDSDGNAE